MSAVPAASACPACLAAPAAEALAQAPQKARLMLALPTAHCAACISDVEAAMLGTPGVQSARVNLTQKRVAVDADAEVTAESLIERLAAVGYPAHELDPDALTLTENDRQGRDLLMRLAVAGFAMMNIMLLSVAVWSGAEAATRDLFHWISAAIAFPTLAFSGQPFFRSAWASIKVRRLGMDVPISLALILASSVSLAETALGGHHAYFDAAVSLCFFLLIGRYLEYRSRAVARSAAEELAALEVPRAIRLEDGAEVVVAVAALRPGDLVLVRPGARLPADGVVSEGMSELDRSLLTGETAPVAVGPGAVLSAGEVNLTGPLILRVRAAGADSSLARMAALVAAAEGAKGQYRSLADRMARGYSPMVHLLAAGSFGTWLYLSGDLRLSVNIAAAVLIITCPCALALAVPAVVTSASGRLFRKGMLIKEGTALERLAEVDVVVFDKTGTLTLGAPTAHVPLLADVADLAIARALGQASSHPHARALALALAEKGIAAVRLDAMEEVPGKGIQGRWHGQPVRLGRADWVGGKAGEMSSSHLSVAGRITDFTFADALRPGALALIQTLQGQGRRVVLLSGDQPGPVGRLAGELGISEWHAGVSPAEKAAHVAGLARNGAKVLMVGDGLNDTAALASAHVSISPASALDAARAASDIVLLGATLEPVADALRIARQARRRIKENFALSLGYNLLAVPVAMIGLATPLLAALAMSSSSIIVSVNSLRLK
jgi:Cu2+-exporting ATPase